MSNERYDLPLGAAPREAIRLLYLSRSRFDGDWNSIPHTHACTELFYCVRGIGQFQIEGVLHEVSTDDLVIVNPQVEHTELSLNANPLEYIVLGVEGIEFLFHEHAKSYALLNCRAAREDMMFLLRNLLQEVDQNAEGCETVCTDYLEILMFKLMRANNFSVRPVTEHYVNKECAVIKRYMDENYTQPITLDQLSEIAHINKFYLIRSFKKEFGVSPITYLARRRLRESKHLLRNTNHSLGQISRLLGFSSPSYFSQSFYRQEGMSPTEYRRIQRQQYN